MKEVILVGGPNGAGKTTFVESFLKSDEFTFQSRMWSGVFLRHIAIFGAFTGRWRIGGSSILMKVKNMNWLPVGRVTTTLH